jgi:hypothetical protein
MRAPSAAATSWPRPTTGFAPLVEAGKLRVLNTWGEKRLAKFPDAPTLKELGIDIVQNSPFGIGAPKGTPPDVVKKLHDAFKKAMEEPSYVAGARRYDMLPMYMSSAQYTQFAQDTVAREKVIIEKLGLAKGSPNWRWPGCPACRGWFPRWTGFSTAPFARRRCSLPRSKVPRPHWPTFSMKRRALPFATRMTWRR